VRVLFNCTGDYGHFHPLAVLAEAMIGRGHEVRFATERSFAGQIAAMGFESVDLPERDPPVGSPELDSWIRERDQEDLGIRAPMVLGWFWDGAMRALPSITEAIEQWHPDVIVREQVAWGAAIAAEIADIPYATFYFRPAPAGLLAAILGDRVERDLQAVGVTDNAIILDTDRHLGLYGGPPGWFGDIDLGPNVQLIRPPLLEANEQEIPNWLESLGTHRPLVYVTMGTVFNRDPVLFRAIIDGLAASNVDALVTLGPKRPGGVTAEQLGDLPVGIRVEEYVAQSLVLPRAAAVIAHGGYGTTMGALAHGLPLVCIPQAALDNSANAECVSGIGAGLVVNDASGEQIAAAISSVLVDPSIRAAAERAATSLDELPDANQAAAMIEAIASVQA
jgi:UDP:flavonoid glycosyltransferase YjiC (YdhE family)